MFNARVVKEKINTITGFWLKGDAYVKQAFTRSSYSNCENSEIFEMYGDAILENYAMMIIHERYGFFRSESNCNFKGDTGYALRGIRNEAALHEIKKKMVCNETLARQIDKWDLAKFLIEGKSDKNNNEITRDKIKADLFEAILGAIAVACDFKSDILKSVVEKMLPLKEIFEEIETSIPAPISFGIEDAVTVLKELAEKGFFTNPEYEFAGPDVLGYLPNGNPFWACTCMVGNIGFQGTVYSNAKRTAKKCVAYMALCRYFERTDDISQYRCNGKMIIEQNGEYEVVDVPRQTEI